MARGVVIVLIAISCVSVTGGSALWNRQAHLQQRGSGARRGSLLSQKARALRSVQTYFHCLMVRGGGPVEMQVDDQGDLSADEPNAGLVATELRGVESGGFEDETSTQDASQASALRSEARAISAFSPMPQAPVNDGPVSFNSSAKVTDAPIYPPRPGGAASAGEPLEEAVPPAAETEEQETAAPLEDNKDLLDDTEDLPNETQTITWQDEIQVHAPPDYLPPKAKPHPKTKNATGAAQNPTHARGNASAAVAGARQLRLKVSGGRAVPRKSLATTAASVAVSKEKAEEAKEKADAAEQAAELKSLRAENAAYAQANAAYGQRIREMVREAKKKKKSKMSGSAPASTSARSRPKGWDQCLQFTRQMKRRGVTGTELIKVWKGSCTPAIRENRASERYKLMCNSFGGALQPFAAQIDYNIDDLCDAVLAVFHDVTAVDAKPTR